MVRSALILIFSLAPLVQGAEKSSSAHKLTPTLDLLPNGSTLTNVRIPVYDDEKRPAALLKASRMEVVSESYVRARDIDLKVYDPDGTEQYQVRMDSADYEVSSGVLEATDKLTIKGEKFYAEGKGGIFQLDSRRGFLHGPVTTSFYLEPDKTSMTTPSAFPSIASILMGASSLALAMPEPLTRGELQKLDQETAGSAPRLLAEVAPTRELNTRSDQLSNLATVGLKSFAKELNNKVILAALVETASKPADPPKAKADALHVTCDGGMFFDAEKGHAVFLKNIRIKEPRFEMKAAKELKIFLEKGPAKEKSKDDTEKAAAGDAKKKEQTFKAPSFEGLSEFSEVKNIIASGGVEVRTKDKEGVPVTATAATAAYDAKTGDIVLRGDFPTVKHGDKFLVAREPGLYLRIYANGSFYTQPGKWELSGSIKEIKKNR